MRPTLLAVFALVLLSCGATAQPDDDVADVAPRANAVNTVRVLYWYVARVLLYE